MAEVIPAILEKNFEEIEKKLRRVEMAVEWVQIDIADGLFVPNTTYLDPQPFSSLKTALNLELHMMVKDPLAYLKKFAPVGFKRFYAHIEADDIDDYLLEAEKLNVEVGLAIDGPTDLMKIWPYVEDVDAVLVMAIKAGFSGQPYLPETEERIRKIRDEYPTLPISVDGSMDDVHAAKVVAAGATRINSNSYIFKEENIQIPIEKLRNLGGIRSKS